MAEDPAPAEPAAALGEKLMLPALQVPGGHPRLAASPTAHPEQETVTLRTLSPSPLCVGKQTPGVNAYSRHVASIAAPRHQTQGQRR